MATNKLSPLDAAQAAQTVYLLRESEEANLAFQRTMSLANMFDFKNTSVRFNATAGAFGFKSSTGFGVCAMGKGEFASHALIVCRGTATAQDVLTDANTGLQTNSDGSVVHAGFNRTFKSMRSDIRSFLSKNNPRAVHCVGHSLGGALANLCADTILHGNNVPEVSLYTFGAPRVGASGFTGYLSNHTKLGKNNIFRVFHAGDPVAMVPLWPFMHAPQPDGEYYINKALHLNPFQHKMGNYIESVKGYTNWSQFQKNAATTISHLRETGSKIYSGEQKFLSFYTLNMISQSIQIILKEILSIPITAIGGAVIAGATLLDQLSYLLDRCSKASSEGKGRVEALLIKILNICGITAKGGITLTLMFIKFVLSVLLRAISVPVSLALKLL